MSAQLGIPPAALATLKESLTCLLLGTVVATGYAFLYILAIPATSTPLRRVYGITVLQAYTYFRHADQRSTGMKFFVSYSSLPDRVGADFCPKVAMLL